MCDNLIVPDMLRVFIMCNGLRSLLPPTTYNTKAFHDTVYSATEALSQRQGLLVEGKLLMH